jgi:hypothetical protein
MRFFKPDTNYALLPTYKQSVCSQNMTSREGSPAVLDAADSYLDSESLQTKPAQNLTYWNQPALVYRTSKSQLELGRATIIVFSFLVLLFAVGVSVSVLLVAFGAFKYYSHSASIPSGLIPPGLASALSPTALTINATPSVPRL